VKKELFGVFAGSIFADLDSKNIRHPSAKNTAILVKEENRQGWVFPEWFRNMFREHLGNTAFSLFPVPFPLFPEGFPPPPSFQDKCDSRQKKKDKTNRKNKTTTSAGFRMEEGWRVHTAPDGRHQPTKTTQWAAPPGWQDVNATPAGDPFARGLHGLLPALYADGVEICRQAAEVPVQVRSSATHDKEDDEDFRK